MIGLHIELFNFCLRNFRIDFTLEIQISNRQHFTIWKFQKLQEMEVNCVQYLLVWLPPQDKQQSTSTDVLVWDTNYSLPHPHLISEQKIRSHF